MTDSNADDSTPIEQTLTALRQTDCAEAYSALGAAFDALGETLTQALDQPGVRSALAKAARAAVAQLREDATFARLNTDLSTSDNFLQTLAKTALLRKALRLEERAVELEQTANALEQR